MSSGNNTPQFYTDKEGNRKECLGKVESVTERVTTPPKLPSRKCEGWARKTFLKSCRPGYEEINYEKCINNEEVEPFSTIQYEKQNKDNCAFLIFAIILLFLFLLKCNY